MEKGEEIIGRYRNRPRTLAKCTNPSGSMSEMPGFCNSR